jgi:ABC-type amino acid transport substrate-binding protein
LFERWHSLGAKSIAIAGCLLLGSSNVNAETVRVVTKPFEPFVFERDEKYVGFSIELWNRIAAELEIETELEGTETIGELIETLEDDRADVAIAGLTVTAEREETIDFSHPYFESGLQILVTGDRPRFNAVTTLVAFLLSPELLTLVGGLLVVLLVAAHAVWIFERKRNPQMFPQSYWRGIWQAFWWAAVTVTTVGYGDKTPTSALGRLVALIWMFTGLILISSFTASVTTVLTVQQLSGRIRTPSDLRGRQVATVDESTADLYLQNRAIDVVAFESIESAYRALLVGQVEAVVYDAPVLQYYASHEGQGKVRVVGPMFQQQWYAIGLVQGSPYREPIDRALLKLRENGTYQQIHDKWFGSWEEGRSRLSSPARYAWFEARDWQR